MGTIDERVGQVVRQLRDALARQYAADFQADCPQELRPGATEAELAGVRAALGGAIPPSYAAFLRLHNGWLHYSGEAMLLPAGEQEAEWVRARVAALREILEEDDEDDVFDDAFIVQMGPHEPDFVVMKLGKRGPTGELPVVQWDLEEGELGVFDSFLEFLEDELEAALDVDEE